MKQEKFTTGLFILILLASTSSLFASGEKEIEHMESGKGRVLRVRIEEGESFRHRMKIAPLIHIKNSPQMALWCETADGKFLTSLFVSERAAKSTWRKAPGDPAEKGTIRRPSALPVWSHSSAGTGVEESAAVDADSQEKAPDAVSSATPKKSFTIVCRLPQSAEDRNQAIQLYFEVNNSTDFNSYYRKDAEKGSPAYSGGPWGSGQPSLIYRAEIPPSLLKGEQESEEFSISFHLAGRGSSDGSDGLIHEDLSHIGSAEHIIAGITAALH